MEHIFKIEEEEIRLELSEEECLYYLKMGKLLSLIQEFNYDIQTYWLSLAEDPHEESGLVFDVEKRMRQLAYLFKVHLDNEAVALRLLLAQQKRRFFLRRFHATHGWTARPFVNGPYKKVLGELDKIENIIRSTNNLLRRHVMRLMEEEERFPVEYMPELEGWIRGEE